MQGCLQKAFTQIPVEMDFALTSLNFPVPEASSESSGAQLGARYTGGAQVLLKQGRINPLGKQW